MPKMLPCCTSTLKHDIIGIKQRAISDFGSCVAGTAYLCEVASVVVQLEVVQVNDVRGDCVQEVSVVRHHNERLFPSLQVLLHKAIAPSQPGLVCYQLSTNQLIILTFSRFISKDLLQNYTTMEPRR
jgi:hypothetical protein